MICMYQQIIHLQKAFLLLIPACIMNEIFNLFLLSNGGLQAFCFIDQWPMKA